MKFKYFLSIIVIFCRDRKGDYYKSLLAYLSAGTSSVKVNSWTKGVHLFFPLPSQLDKNIEPVENERCVLILQFTPP